MIKIPNTRAKMLRMTCYLLLFVICDYNNLYYVIQSTLPKKTQLSSSIHFPQSMSHETLIHNPFFQPEDTEKWDQTVEKVLRHPPEHHLNVLTPNEPNIDAGAYSYRRPSVHHDPVPAPKPQRLPEDVKPGKTILTILHWCLIGFPPQPHMWLQ